MVGQWKVFEQQACDLPEKAATAFGAVYGEERLGFEIKPVLYCGEQLVSGHNYMFICEVTQVTNPPKRKLLQVVIYETLDGEYYETYCSEFIEGIVEEAESAEEETESVEEEAESVEEEAESAEEETESVEEETESAEEETDEEETESAEEETESVEEEAESVEEEAEPVEEEYESAEKAVADVDDPTE